jgi:hypothetical protein
LVERRLQPLELRISRILLGASVGNAESSHDLVKDKECAIFFCKLADSFQEFLVGLDESRVPNDGLEDDSSNLSLVVIEMALTESTLLYLAQRVALVADFGTPGKSGKPRVATPDPAWTRKTSACL